MTRIDGSSGRLRIAVGVRKIAFGDGVGGMERAAGQHIEQLANGGVDVTLYTPVRFMRGTPLQEVRVVDVGWPSWNGGPGVPTFGIAYYLWVSSLARVLEENARRHDIVHLHGGAAGVLGHATFRAATVVNPHGMEEFEPASLSRYPNRYFSRKLVRQARHADRVIATDDALIDVIIANIGVDRRRVVVIPNSVDVAALDDLAAVGAVSKRFTVISIGRLVKNKGYDLLLDVLKRADVREALPSGWRWFHFGSGPEGDSIRAKAASSPPVPLEILSNRNDAAVQTALAHADIFVQPSRHEGSSLTTLEAMSHGIKVVATAVGGIPDKVHEGQTGYLAASPTEDDIAAALLRAIKGGSSIGSRARCLVERRFSSQATSAAYLSLYSELDENRDN